MTRSRIRILRSTQGASQDRKSTRLNSSHSQISYAVFCLKKKKASQHMPVHQRIARVSDSPIHYTSSVVQAAPSSLHACSALPPMFSLRPIFEQRDHSRTY